MEFRISIPLLYHKLMRNNKLSRNSVFLNDSIAFFTTNGTRKLHIVLINNKKHLLNLQLLKERFLPFLYFKEFCVSAKQLKDTLNAFKMTHKSVIIKNDDRQRYILLKFGDDEADDELAIRIHKIKYDHC